MKALVFHSTILGSAVPLIIFFHSAALYAGSCPAPSFAVPRVFDAGIYPNSVVAGDFNADGKPDLAVVGDGGISVLLGKGDGIFQTAVSYNAGAAPRAVTEGDFNGDGKPDLVVANIGSYDQSTRTYSNGGISVLLGKGDGTFQDAVNYGAGLGSAFVVVADFNGDGRPDLAVANNGSPGKNFSDGSISILLGNGDGTFKTAVNYAAGAGPNSLAVGDFDGDSRLDLAVGNRAFFDDATSMKYNRGHVSILLGKGDGTFQTPLSFLAGNNPFSVAVGDFNDDGKLDLAVADLHEDGVLVFAGKGDGTFQPAIAVAGSGIALAVGDFNGDGKSDLAVANYSENAITNRAISVLLGKGDGSFKAVVNYAVGSVPVSLALGDFNGDRQVDLAVANYRASVSVLLGNGDGTFQEAISYFSGEAYSVLAADFDGDGKPELVVAGSVLRNTCGSANPDLAIARSGATVTVSWPFPSTGFVLESATSIGATNWQPAGEVALTIGGRWEVTVPLNSPQRFFRLQKN